MRAGTRIGRRSRGFAVIAIVMVLALLAAWAGLGTVSAGVAQARGAAWQAHEVESLAAAETGIAWMLARLNEVHGHGDACEAVPAAGSGAAPGGASRPPLIERLLASDVDGPWRAVPGPPVGCVRDGGDWRCDCDADAGLAAAPSPTASGSGGPVGTPRTAFQVTVEPGVQADGRGVVRLVAWGCIRGDGDCLRPTAPGERPTRRVQVDLAVVPMLAAVPSGVWTATGDVTLGPGTEARNRAQASAGLVVHAGGSVPDLGARLVGQAGAPPADAVAAGDGWLAAHGWDDLSTRLFGLPQSDFGRQPRVAAVDCGRSAEVDCAARLAAALAGGAPSIRIAGDWRPGPGLSLGTPARPVLLVVDGAARLTGPATVHGLVVARDLEVDGRGGRVHWHGAGVAAGRIRVQGAVVAERDADTLASLSARPAAVLPAPGSWRDVTGRVP